MQLRPVAEADVAARAAGATPAALDLPREAGEACASWAPRVLLLFSIAFLLLPFDFLRGALGHLPHLRSTLGGPAAPAPAGGGGSSARAPSSAGAAAPAAPPLPAGGGGDGADVEWWGECQAAIACADCGVARDPSLPIKLPAVYAPLQAVVDRADYTRSAVMAAWVETLDSVPALRRPGPHFTALETAHDVEHEGWPEYAGVYRDECVFDYTDACDVHRFRVERPLAGAQRQEKGASTGHPALKRAPYDFQMYSQTFEHLYDPPLAVARMFELAAPGGMLWLSVPAWNIIHMNPSHQQGITPCGVFGLFRGAGFEVLKLGWYGNEAYGEALVRPGSNWPPWTALPVVSPFTAMPPTATGGRVNTVWALVRRPAGAPLPLPAPRPTLAELDARPSLDADLMISAAEIRKGFGRGPSAATLAALLRRFPGWAAADVAALVFAGYVQEAFLPKLAAAGALGGGRGAGEAGAPPPPPPLLLFGRTATAIASALLPADALRRWVPPGLARADSEPVRAAAAAADAGASAAPAAGGPRRRLSRAALLTDLFESARDPLAVLRGALAELEPGAPLLVACRPADVVAVGRPTLGVCTELGFTQLLFRAGLLAGARAAGGFSTLATSYGAWGRAAYTQAAVVRGVHTTLADAAAAQLAGRPAQQLLRALGAGAPVQAGADEALLLEVLESVAKSTGEEQDDWSAVAWALLEKGHA